MRRRITKAFFATAAAGATITTLGLAASPAGAASHGVKAFTPSGGTPIPTNAQCTVTPLPSDNCGMAGYQASGRDFRFASALINVPNHTGVGDVTSPAVTGDPALYVALDSSSSATYQFARVGIAPCTDPDDFVIPGVTFATAGGTTFACPSSGWVVFDAVYQPTTTPTVNVAPLATSLLGDGIGVSVYLASTGLSVQTTITLPSGSVIQHVIPVSGPTYTKALALGDWTTSIENGNPAPQPAVPSAKIRDTQFFQGRFTTLNGTKGTFNGPWTLNALEATSNGSLPPTGTLIGQPSYLWNDGNSYNGMGDDAFGIWRFPF
jgi:hypothetical protein